MSVSGYILFHCPPLEGNLKQRIIGFMFDLGDERDSNPIRPKTNPRRYFSKTGLIYKDSLEELATRLIDRAGGLVEKRLSRIYDEILFDEVQDISRWGLEVIARLLRQDSVRCLLIGDGQVGIFRTK